MDAKQELDAQKIQAQIMLGDREPIKVKCSNGETYNITRTKTRINVLASEQFMEMSKVQPFHKELTSLHDTMESLGEEDLETRKEISKKLEDLNQQMINEFISNATNAEQMCKALAYIILNDVRKIEDDEYIKPVAFRKFFGAKAKKRPEKDRFWYKLYCELDNSDIFNLFAASTKKFSTEVFFYTMGLIQNLNQLKAQSPAEL